MSGWAAAVSDALLSVLTGAGLYPLEAHAESGFVEIEQRIQILKQVEVGESIEMMSGVVAVSIEGFTVAHLGRTLSAEQSDVARCWSVVRQSSAAGSFVQCSPAVMQKLELLRVEESEMSSE